ncbi:MAG: response regulator transcription factor [Leptolyngbya sp. SIO1D8]|nr:response regulator transcription factor [Leptolyngbya sp. SIO1D8]
MPLYYLRRLKTQFVLSTLTPEIMSDLIQVAMEWPSEAISPILLLLEVWDTPQFLVQLISTSRVNLLPLTVSADQVRRAISTIEMGLIVLHPEITETLSASARSAFMPIEVLPAAQLETLTPREIEVLRQLAAGLSNKAIANTLEISEHTVKFHISAILSKLGVSSRTEAVAVGIRAGLVML